jgi:hypothetical protein
MSDRTVLQAYQLFQDARWPLVRYDLIRFIRKLPTVEERAGAYWLLSRLDEIAHPETQAQVASSAAQPAAPMRIAHGG